MSDTKKDVKFFSDISSYHSYSKMSKNLNKIYKNKCFDSFFQNLKRPKATSFADDYYANIMKLEPSSNKKQEIIFSTELVEGMLKREEIQLKHSSRRKKDDHIRKINPTLSNKNHKKEILNQSRQDLYTLGKYNPNYEAIYVNKPSIEFSKHTGRNIQSNLRIKQSFPSAQNKENVDKNISVLHNKNNHSLRFSKYSWRKAQYKKSEEKDDRSYINCKTENTNANAIKSIKGIDFGKMKCVNHIFPNLNDQSENCPTIGMYNPKYSSISKNIPTIVFRIEREKLRNKKYQLRKLWNSYVVTNDYQIVNMPHKD